MNSIVLYTALAELRILRILFILDIILIVWIIPSHTHDMHCSLVSYQIVVRSVNKFLSLYGQFK